MDYRTFKKEQNRLKTENQKDYNELQKAIAENKDEAVIKELNEKYKKSLQEVRNLNRSFRASTSSKTKKPVEQKPVAQKSVEKKSAENKPAEKKPVVQKPVEKKPVEKKPVEKKPVAQKPAEKKSAENKPAEKKPETKPIKSKKVEVVSHEGIENRNIHSISYQLDDWEIDKFEELKRDLEIAEDPEEMKKIRQEMAVILKEEAISQPSQTATSKKDEEETKIEKVDNEDEPKTIDEIIEEYKKISDEIDEKRTKGMTETELKGLYERYYTLKLEADKLEKNTDNEKKVDITPADTSKAEPVKADKEEENHFTPDEKRRLKEELEKARINIAKDVESEVHKREERTH